jgi:transcriptional regulator with XRE-family HTH domain
LPEPQPNYELLRERLRRARRQRGLSLREVADEIEVSASTLSRIEREAGTPDVPTMNRLIDWLELDRDAVFGAKRSPAKSTPEHVEVLLRADKNLDARTAKTLARIFRAAYREMVNG